MKASLTSPLGHRRRQKYPELVVRLLARCHELDRSSDAFLVDVDASLIDGLRHTDVVCPDEDDDLTHDCLPSQIRSSS